MKTILFLIIEIILFFFVPIVVLYSSFWALNVFENSIISLIFLLFISTSLVGGYLEISTIFLKFFSGINLNFSIISTIVLALIFLYHSLFKTWFDSEFIKLYSYEWLFKLYYSIILTLYYFTITYQIANKVDDQVIDKN